MASRLRGACTFAAARSRPMYRITCPSRTRLHARSQVLARHRSLMYRIIGHYPAISRGQRPIGLSDIDDEAWAWPPRS